MFIAEQIKRTKNIYHDYPSQFWVVIGAGFIDQVGGALLYPFFALYITRHFGVGMTQVGLLYMLFSAANVVGNTIGGAVTDYIGRKKVILLGLVISGLTSLGMGLVDRLPLFYMMGVLAGLFAQAAGPARQAMLTDILPEKKRAEGFGVMRVAMNLAVAIGPAMGGLLAARSYLGLFIADTVSSLITAIIVHYTVQETQPAREKKSDRGGSFLDTFRGYGKVLKDRPFMLFLGIYLVVTLVYIQMQSTLSVFLRDVHGVPERGFGFIMALNAAMVVIFQFWITRRLRGLPSLLMMAGGALLYGLGFGMYGFVISYPLFLGAMAVITVGEMIIAPVAQSLVSKMAPEHMRGRYMGVMGYAWMIPGMVGPYLAGMVMDHYDPRLVWYVCGILGGVASLGYYWLYRSSKRAPAAAEKLSNPQPGVL